MRTYSNNNNNKLDSTSVPLLLKFAVQMYRTYVQGMAGYLLQHANDHWFQGCIQAKWKIITHLQLFQEILSSCQNNRTAGWEEGWDQFKLAFRLKKLMQSHSHGCLEDSALSHCWAGAQQRALLCANNICPENGLLLHYIWAVGEQQAPLEPQISTNNTTSKSELW